MYPYSAQALKENEEKYNNELMPIEADKKLVDLISEAIKGEMHDEAYYSKLMEKVDDEEAFEIIREIMLDEMKHKKMFTDVYVTLTGTQPDIQIDEVEVGNNVLKDYAERIMEELGGAEFYRKVYFAFLNDEIKDLALEALIDEQAHAAKLNYLYAKTK